MGKTIGDKIREIRYQNNMKQVELAVALDIARPYVAQIESNKRKPSRDLLLKISKEFNVSIDWLTSDESICNPVLAQNEDEARLLSAFRSMPQEEAKMYLKLMIRSVDEPVIKKNK